MPLHTAITFKRQRTRHQENNPCTKGNKGNSTYTYEMNSSDSVGSQTQKYDAQRSCGVSFLGGAQDLARLSPDHLLALVTLLRKGFGQDDP